MKKYQVYWGSKEVIRAKSEDMIKKTVSEMSQTEFETLVDEELGSCGGLELQGEYENLDEAKKHVASGWRIEGTAYGDVLKVECSLIEEVIAWDEDGDPAECETVYSEYPSVEDIAGDYGKTFRIRETAKDGARTIYDDIYYDRDEAEQTIRDYMAEEQDDPERAGVVYDLVEVI